MLRAISNAIHGVLRFVLFIPFGASFCVWRIFLLLLFVAAVVGFIFFFFFMKQIADAACVLKKKKKKMARNKMLQTPSRTAREGTPPAMPSTPAPTREVCEFLASPWLPIFFMALALCLIACEENAMQESVACSPLRHHDRHHRDQSVPLAASSPVAAMVEVRYLPSACPHLPVPTTWDAYQLPRCDTPPAAQPPPHSPPPLVHVETALVHRKAETGRRLLMADDMTNPCVFTMVAIANENGVWQMWDARALERVMLMHAARSFVDVDGGGVKAPPLSRDGTMVLRCPEEFVPPPSARNTT
jgi:hypothetical protein